MAEDTNTLEAAKKIIPILQPFSLQDCKKILSWVSEEVGCSEKTEDFMGSLFAAFNISNAQEIKRKEYWLNRFKTLTGLTDTLEDQVKDLGRGLCGIDKKGGKEAEVSVRHIDRKQLLRFFNETEGTSETGMINISVEQKKLSKAELWNEVQRNTILLDEVRNQRQYAITAFQSFDQKANQLYNLLSSVMKAMNEMSSGVIRNML